MPAFVFQEPPMQRLKLPHGEVWIQRDDLIHPVISGNKWRKLQGWLDVARGEGRTTLLTYGGAFSNHLLATAGAAAAFGYASIGVLRGEEPLENAYLQAARGFGMETAGVSRTLYRDKSAALRWVMGLEQFKQVDWSKVLVIEEGGRGPAGFPGFLTLANQWQSAGFQPSHICHASATATTAVGLALALQAHGWHNTQILAVPVLKNLPEQQSLAALHGVEKQIHWLSDHAGAGYAKVTPQLAEFTASIEQANNIPFEPIYTGKALTALNAWLRENPKYAESGNQVVFLHTGGCFAESSLVSVG